MDELDANAYAMLELVADKPLPMSIVPLRHLPIVEQLSRSGLLMKSGSQWFASAEGLRMVGRTLH